MIGFRVLSCVAFFSAISAARRLYCPYTDYYDRHDMTSTKRFFCADGETANFDGHTFHCCDVPTNRASGECPGQCRKGKPLQKRSVLKPIAAALDELRAVPRSQFALEGEHVLFSVNHQKPSSGSDSNSFADLARRGQNNNKEDLGKYAGYLGLAVLAIKKVIIVCTLGLFGAQAYKSYGKSKIIDRSKYAYRTHRSNSTEQFQHAHG